MPTWTIQDSKTGEEFEIEGDREPSQQEAQAALDDFLASESSSKKTSLSPVKSEEPSLGKSLLTSMVPHPGDAYTAAKNASKEGGEAWVDAANEIVPNLPGLGGLRIPEFAGKALNPLASRLAGASAATLELAKPVTGPTMMADRSVRELGKRIYADAAGTELTPEREAALRRYTLTGEEGSDVSDYKTPSLGRLAGQSTVAQALAGVGTDVANYPVTNLALAKGLAKIGAPAEGGDVPGFAKTPRELKLLRGVIKPQAGTKFAKNFNEAGSNGLRLISEEAPSKGGDSFQRLTFGADKALEKLGEKRASMMEDAAGKTISGKSIKQGVSRLGDDPYYKNLDPEGALYFQERAGTITSGPIPVEEAQAMYSTIEKMIRRARKASGDAEAALENNDKFQYLESIRENLGKQLNETVSRTPNEYLENSRNFSDVYRVFDRAEHAEGLFRNDPSNTFVWRDLGNFEGWKSFLKKVGLKRTSETDLAASLKRAGKTEIAPPEALPPQKPSTLPQSPEVSIYDQFPSLTEEYPVEPPSPHEFPVRPMQIPPRELRIGKLEPRSASLYNPRSEYNTNGIKLGSVKGRPAASYVEATKAPYKPAPWIKDVALNAFTKDPVGRIAEVELARKIVIGGDSKLFAKALNNPETSTWMKNVLKRLSENPETAVQDVAELEAAVKRRFDPFAETRLGKPKR